LRAWSQRKAWSDRYLPVAEGILRRNGAEHISYRIGSYEEDAERGWDYLAVAGDRSVGFRFRTPKHTAFPSRDVTFRSRLASGRPTELDKLLEGNAPDLYLIGWTAPGMVQPFADFFLFRLGPLLKLDSPRFWPELPNRDGSWFVYRDIEALRAIPGCAVDWHRGALEATFVNPAKPLAPRQQLLL
jgi:hypothetical protein